MKMRCGASRKRWTGWLAALALLAGTAFGAVSGGASPDGWSAAQVDVLASLRLDALEARAADPSNAYESSPAAARLGQRIFFDPRFSANGAVSCASCHQPERQFQDGRPLGQGVGTGARRTMPLAGAAHAPFLFWDGRKDSLWSQALGPLEDAAEHGGTRLAYAHVLRAHYRQDYEAVFGPMPELSRLPAEGGPLGTPAQRAAWERMREDERHAVSRVFANLGKALAAYEKDLMPGPARLDRYVGALTAGDPRASALLSPAEKNGLRIFIGKGQCVTCHAGPLLSDQSFHNTGVFPRLAERPDQGRAAAIARLRADEFNCLGRFSDARPDQCGELRFLADDDETARGAFRTPGLRNVARRAPYMHAGQLATLEDVVRHYTRAPRAATGHSELRRFSLSDAELRDLVAFLGTLNEEQQ